MKKTMLKGLLSATLFLAIVPMLHASQPKWSIIPLTTSAVQIPPNGTVHVQYEVTNNTLITRTLTLVQKPGIKQGDQGTCSQPFTLASGQNCILDVVVDSLAIGVPNLGPEICKTQMGTNVPDPFLCSQAAAVNQIRATRGTNPV